MSEPTIQRYARRGRCPDPDGLEPRPDGPWVKFSDLAPYVATKVRAERERCRRDEVEPLRAALKLALDSADHADDCPDFDIDAAPDTCNCWRGVVTRELTAVRKAQEETK